MISATPYTTPYPSYGYGKNLPYLSTENNCTITVCPRSSDPFYYSNLLYKMARFFLDRRQPETDFDKKKFSAKCVWTRRAIFFTKYCNRLSKDNDFAISVHLRIDMSSYELV